MSIMQRLPRLNYGKVTWVIFILVVAVLFIASTARKKHSPLADVVVEIVPLLDGSKLIVEKNVQSVVRKGFGKNLTNEPLIDLDFERIEQVLEADPFIKKADAYMGINNRLHLRIEQRQPVIRILDQNGGNYYIDPLGHRIPISPNFTARVPVATGNIPPYAPDFLSNPDHTLTKLMHLRYTLAEDEQLEHFIQQIHVDGKGEFLMVPLLGKAKIKLGTLAHLEDKLSRAKLFYEEAAPHTGWNAYKMIDLRYQGQIVGVR